MRRYHFIATLASAVALAGCTSFNQPPTPIHVEQPIHPLNELHGIAVEARDELRLLAKIMDAKNSPTLTRDQHAQKHFQAVFVPKGFERNATFKYTGKASKAAEALAKVAGYKFKTLGEPIPNEPWVSININNIPLNEALKELGVQTGSAMRIEVHDGVILAVYKNQWGE